MKVIVLLPNGQEHSMAADSRGSLMDALREAGVPIRAECGGAMACATCHVHVDESWIERVGSPGDEEDDLLYESDYHSEFSRLSCQIDCVDALDGLKVALQLDSLED